MLQFSGWLGFDIDPEHAGPAVYQFRLVEADAPVRLGRMLGVDQDGILVIGCTTNMLNRCYQSRSGWRKASGSSTMNWLYYIERHTPFRDHHPTARFEYRFAVAESEAQVVEWEERLLKSYFRRFGELPPLNAIMPNRYGGYDEDAALVLSE